MDSNKDIQSNKGQYKSVDKKESHPVDDYFAQDESFVFIYKKTEKLATAMYMVTNLFGDSEPMKWTLRTKVSQLLSFIIGFKDISKSREEEFFHEIKIRVLEIVSLLEVSSRSGLVSPMNFSILKSEFMHMTEFVTGTRQSSHDIHGTVDLNTSFFSVSRTASFPKDTGRFSPSYTGEGNREFKGESEQEPKRNTRQNTIIHLLKRKADVTIHDVAEVIPGCSEKTIQRELIALIQSGIVKKTGQRRWSKYSLV
jgi:hypothetical protein